MDGEENTPFVTEYEGEKYTFVQKGVKCPMIGIYKI